jgi:hypothetical protein
MKSIGVIIFVFVFILSAVVFVFQNSYLRGLVSSTISGSTSTQATPPAPPQEASSTPPLEATSTQVTEPPAPGSATPPSTVAPQPTPRSGNQPAPAPVSPSGPPPIIRPGSGPTSEALEREEFLKNLDPSDIPQGLTAKQLSTKFRQVRFWTVEPADSSDADATDYLWLYADDGIARPVTMSNWSIKTNRHRRSIGRGVSIIDPDVYPAAKDMVLNAGDTFIVHSGAPALGVNFRLNKCIGYLNAELKFSPALPSECPYPGKYDIYRLPGECQDYITGLDACQIADVNASTDVSCRVFLSKLNYAGCLDRHRKDADFLASEWWAWVGQRFLDPLHDRVQLIDQYGLVVDEYVY